MEYKELGTNEFIERISTEKLYNKSIKLKHSNKDYVVVRSYYNGVFLVLTLLNKNSFNEQDYDYEVNRAQTSAPKDYINRINNSNIDAIVIAIDNPLLRDSRFDDFYIYCGKDIPLLWKYEISDGAWASFIDDNDNVITNAKNIKFPVIIKGLRKMLLKAMPEDLQEEYLRQYKKYCLSTIEKLLKEREKLINRTLKELQQKSQSLQTQKDKVYQNLLDLEDKNSNITL